MFEVLPVLRLTMDIVKGILRCAAVAIAICSWLAISNHCAFAAMAKSTASQRAACPFHSKPEKQKPHSTQAQCCKSLRAVVFVKPKNWERDDANFCDINFPNDERALPTCSLRTAQPLLLDTGPPGASSFAELILQRSLLAHAPPPGA
jgi:hypothetical protein